MMSIAQLEHLEVLRHPEYSIAEQVLYFLYDHHYDPDEFLFNFPGSVLMSMGWLEGWQWTINEQGLIV